MTSETKQRIINDMLALDKYKKTDIAKAAHVSLRDVKFVKLPPITKITRDGNNGNIIKTGLKTHTYHFSLVKEQMIILKRMFESEESKWKNKSRLGYDLVIALRETMGVDRIG